MKATAARQAENIVVLAKGKSHKSNTVLRLTGLQ